MPKPDPQTTKSLLAAIDRLEHRLHETIMEANAVREALKLLKEEADAQQD